MLRPKLPEAAPARTAYVAQHNHAPACSCQHTPAPAGGRSVTPYVGLGIGAVAAVIAEGVVLTALLATVAITAVSVSIAAVVLRSLLNGTHQR
jgi:hypothetical protein